MRRKNAQVQALANTLEFSNVFIFFPCFDTFDFKYIFFFFQFIFLFLIFTQKKNNKKTISIVECEAFGLKCLGYFFEPSPNELAALLIAGMNLTRITFGGNRHIYQ